MNNGLYRNNPPYVNFNLYERRNTLRKNELEKLLRQLRRYRNEYHLGSSKNVRNTLQNLENNLLRESKFGRKGVTRENILKAKTRLRRVHRGYRMTPFSSSNLKSVQLRHVSPVSAAKKSLANLTFNKLVKQGRLGNIPLNVLPRGTLMRGITSPRMGITGLNLRIGKTNLNTVRNFKNYINLLRNSHNYNTSNINNQNIARMFRTTLAAYRNKYGLTVEQERKLKLAVVKITRFPNNKNPFLVKLRQKYLKKGFLNAKNIARLMIAVKK